MHYQQEMRAYVSSLVVADQIMWMPCGNLLCANCRQLKDSVMPSMLLAGQAASVREVFILYIFSYNRVWGLGLEI